MPVAKDLKFFSEYFDRGFAWYESFFRKARSEHLAVGEICHDYFLEDEYAERIYRYLPDCKILIVLRDPIARLISAYIFDRSTILPPTETFEDYCRRPEVTKVSCYLNNVDYFIRRFPREKIKILFFEELEDDSAKFLHEVYRFLEVRDDFLPTDYQEKVFEAHQAYFPSLGHLSYSIAQTLRLSGMSNLVGAIKRNRRLMSLIFKTYTPTLRICPDTINDLIEKYRDELDTFEQVTNLSSPPNWLKFDNYRKYSSCIDSEYLKS